MTPLKIGAIAVYNLAELILNLFIIVKVDGDPRIILIAFLSSLIIRYLVLWILLKLYARFPGIAESRWCRILTRHPSEGGAYIEKKSDLSVAHHLMLIFFLAFFPYTIIAIPLGTFVEPLQAGWIFPVLGIRLLHDLLSHSFVYVDFSKSEQENAGYNFHEILTLLILFLLVSLLVPFLGLLSMFKIPGRFIGSHIHWIVAIAFLIANQFIVFSRGSAPEYSVKKE